MDNGMFEEIERQLTSGGAEAGFSFLVEQFRREKKYPLLFEARLMNKRHELELPLIQTDSMDKLPEETRRSYEQATVEAAREVGGLFLSDGQIERAWPYFRAIGEPSVVAEAIDKLELEKGAEGVDAIIAIAFHEGIHPRKGFELILEHHGICRAITGLGQYPVSEGREESALLLTRTLHGEIAAGIKRVIAQQEGQAPAAASLPELIEGREWLFEGGSYYSDSSHVASVVQQSIHLKTPETLRLALELAEYGQHLAPMFHYKGEPPFENIYEDHAVYLRALLGEDVEQAIAHFRTKIAESDPEQVGTAPAEALVNLLCRLDRHAEALDVFRKHLSEADPNYLRCPTQAQLCQLSRDFTALRDLAEQRGDLLSFAAAALQA